ncbi:hypothetical protein, partial [Enterobacter cloacae complex sp. P24RS]|uniref:hypothetical protein n=1 Tax=Enterobacter cloacae complex sp. P24RS TaxID=2779568 RepID=UPI001D0BE7B7
SEVKRRSADGSVGSPHVRVGNCQASIKETPYRKVRGFLLLFFPLSLWVRPSNRTILSLKLSHLLLADSTLSPFLGIVGCLDV